MLYGFLVFLFSLLSVFIILIVLFQKGQGNLFSGRFGNEASAVLGGSQNDVLQKITWFFGIIFMFFAFFLTIYNSKLLNESKYFKDHISEVKKETKPSNNQEKLEEDLLNKHAEKEDDIESHSKSDTK